jgi:hypothetical protein
LQYKAANVTLQLKDLKIMRFTKLGLNGRRHAIKYFMIWIFRAIISTDFFAVMNGLTLLHHASKCPLACTFELVLTLEILFLEEVF